MRAFLVNAGVFDRKRNVGADHGLTFNQVEGVHFVEQHIEESACVLER